MMSPPDSSDGKATDGAHQERDPEIFKKKADEDGVHALGEALAGVNIGTKSPGNSFGAPSAPFALAPGGGSGGSGSQADHDGWDLVEAATQAAFSAANMREISGSRVREISGSGVRDKTPNGIEAHLRNESLELFLSQSPSRTLGDDVFKLSHPNLPALGREEELRSSGVAVGGGADSAAAFRMTGQSLAPGLSGTNPNKNNFGEIRPEVRRRTESPSCSVTGTTTSSRSVSPYTNSDLSGSRTIQAYQRYDSAPASTDALSRNQASITEDERSNNPSINHGHGSHPSLTTLDPANHRSPYSKERNHIKSGGSGSPYDMQTFDRSAGFSPQLQMESQPPGAPQQISSHPQQQQPPQQQQQSQVLYMAVPSPDGRGQVLQPVQMLQLPGKPYTYVVPGAAGGNTLQGNMGDGSQNNMMVLPPLANQSLSDYSGLAEARAPMDSRRIPNFSPETTSRQQQQYGNNMDAQLGRIGGEEYLRSTPPMNNTGLAPAFPADSAVASLYSAPQRPPLEALLGQVRRLSRDQVGCRLVQQALDEEGPMAATHILNEGLPFWGEAMVDPFGNYLFQKILEKITPQERIMLVKSVSTRLVNASLNLHGTRSVQKVVELCAIDEQQRSVGREETSDESAADILTKSLAPAAARLCIDSHGNHVIQRILLKLGHKHSKFVFDAVAASVGDVARHRHGCCVIQRCLDSPPSEARSHLVHRIVEKALELMQDAYGNYVVQYVLDVCSDDDVHAVCESVVGKVNLLAIQKFSSNVMEKCLERCSDRVKELYMQEMSDPERIRELMMDPFGNYVVQRALSVATHVQAIRLVEAMRPHLIATQTGGPNGQRNGGVRNTAGGRRIIAKICRRFPNFTLSSVGSQDELYSQNKGNHRHHGPVLAAYAPVGASPGHAQHYAAADPRLSQAHMAMPQAQQQPSYYNLGGNPYYDHYSTGHTGYPGM